MKRDRQIQYRSKELEGMFYQRATYVEGEPIRKQFPAITKRDLFRYYKMLSETRERLALHKHGSYRLYLLTQISNTGMSGIRGYEDKEDYIKKYGMRSYLLNRLETLMEYLTDREDQGEVNILYGFIIGAEARDGRGGCDEAECCAIVDAVERFHLLSQSVTKPSYRLVPERTKRLLEEVFRPDETSDD